MFMGEYQHNIDDKNRLTIPAKFRDSLGLSFVVTRGLDRCLFVYPMDEWKALTEKLASLPFTKADARAFTRFFFSGAAECEWDKQGRVNIPPHLREHGRLSKECVVIGVQNRVEIWSKSEWDAYSEAQEDSFGEIAEKLVDFNL
ncbi:division/cell wall cluster transcriptional repressor MraZ [Brevibacillus daliensis]|uniref:division/cell wall cluster transcriptional repressor MraZ n=1 Tax=Brevibacillus daliensis TaxID=2892995 RepID=UPI001E610907|nr:division/cell wall cluster transcriptional repressor MraZ [Brevibacillus daliensis]